MSHAGAKERNWRLQLPNYYVQSEIPAEPQIYQMPDEMTQTPGSHLLRYRTWYSRVGGGSLYLRGDYSAYLRQPLQEDLSGHQPTGRRWARSVINPTPLYYMFIKR
jgi:hypothetical protein